MKLTIVNFKLTLVLLLPLLSGCGMTAAYKASAPTLQAASLSDQTIFQNSSDRHEFYAAKSGKAKVFGTGGAIGLAGLATAAAAGATGGMTAGGISMLVSIGNFIGQILGIVEPTNRAIAYDAGANDIDNAQADYLECITARGRARVSPDSITSCGAGLLKKLGAITRVVDAMVNQTRYTKADLDIVEAKLNSTLIKAEEEKANDKSAVPVPTPTP